MLFLIESKKVNNIEIPAQYFGYATIEAIQYKNWWNNNDENKFYFNSTMNMNGLSLMNYTKAESLTELVPVGSVEYCLEYYKNCGVKNIKPLNIPMQLRKFCNHDIDLQIINRITDGGYPNLSGKFFVKSENKIKDDINGIYDFPNDIAKFKKGEEYFISSWKDNIESEWRCFIYNKQILGIKCYSGDEFILPNKNYIQNIVDFYDKKCYTLDIMVDENERNDIVELHDFFSCGLYGFDHPKLLDMMITTHKEILLRELN